MCVCIRIIRMSFVWLVMAKICVREREREGLPDEADNVKHQMQVIRVDGVGV